MSNNRFGNRNGNRGGGRSSTRGGYGGGRGGGAFSRGGLGSEICFYYTEDRCTKGAQCQKPHFIKRIGETRGHKSAVKDVVMWASKQQVFTCSQDGTIKLWDCATWNEVATIPVCTEIAIKPNVSETRHYI